MSQGYILVGLFDDELVEPLDAQYRRIRLPLTNHALIEKKTHYGFLNLFTTIEHQARAETELPAIFGPFQSHFPVSKLGVWIGDMGPIFVDAPQMPCCIHPGDTITIPAGWPIALS